MRLLCRGPVRHATPLKTKVHVTRAILRTVEHVMQHYIIKRTQISLSAEDRRLLEAEAEPHIEAFPPDQFRAQNASTLVVGPETISSSVREIEVSGRA